jgi:hypothetical protein
MQDQFGYRITVLATLEMQAVLLQDLSSNDVTVFVGFYTEIFVVYAGFFCVFFIFRCRGI